MNFKIKNMKKLRERRDYMNKFIFFVTKFIFFVAHSLKTDTSESSKRLFGAIGFITAIVYIAIWGHDLIETLLYVSAALLGLETVSNIFRKK